ncbi:g8942 [Coccomyxa elongata]
MALCGRVQPFTVASQNIRAARRTSTVCCSSTTHVNTNRRYALGAVLVVPSLLAAPSAIARDINAAARAREERKAQLRAAAQDMKQTGKAEAAFEESQYSVGDDKSPNIHTREEGVRTSK